MWKSLACKSVERVPTAHTLQKAKGWCGPAVPRERGADQLSLKRCVKLRDIDIERMPIGHALQKSNRWCRPAVRGYGLIMPAKGVEIVWTEGLLRHEEISRR